MSYAGEDLAKLCAQHGVATAYHDIWGKRHEVSAAGLRALLAELGVDAPTSESAGHAERTATRDRGPLEPVVAITAGAAPWSTALRAPAGAGELRWRLSEEGGAVHEGRVPAGPALEVAVAMPPGYHRLELLDAQRRLAEALVIAAPARCYHPEVLADGARLWGPAVQLYSLRSERNWGIGDFADLERLIEDWSALGAGVFGLNPLHALFPHRPEHCSPYSPSSRERFNTLYLDVEAIEEFRECEPAQQRVRSAAFQARLAGLREAPLVDYAGVAAAKHEVLELLHACFRERHAGPGSARGREFREWFARGGEPLRRHAIFEALQAGFGAADPASWDWRHWSEALKDPAGEAVARFAAGHADRVEYFAWLQWQAERQLARVRARCAALGLALGLYLDLAVSVDRGGSDTWSDPDSYALGASVGAPPDEFNLNGQDWGLPPLHPERLRRSGYAVVRRALEASMRHAGALRIDHVMGLMRLFWISLRSGAREGSYVHYAFDEMLAVVALESHRQRCVVIGEDLGTVPDEVRAGLERIGVLSYRLLPFEREPDGAFKPGGAYPREALVAVSTHDLPTLAGWWQGYDLLRRRELGLFADERAYETQLVARAQERVRLMLALQHAGVLPGGTVIEPAAPQDMSPALAEAVHAFLAAAPSRIMMVQLEDMLGATEQANMPGTTTEQPNWRRKLPLPLERMRNEPRVVSLARRLAAERPHPARPAPASPRQASVPLATYRLQLHRGFDFDAAARLVPYLARLGISHAYCSPILRARSASPHGYDITHHGEIAPDLGGSEGFERFAAALRRHGMGILLDVVPNHMAVLGADNEWWMDVLENGPSSLYARYFDIDWLPVNVELAGKVLLPVLGAPYGSVLAAGELAVVFEPAAGAFAVRYHEHRFPVDPRSYAALLARAGELLPGEAAAALRDELGSLAAAFGHLPPRDATGAGSIAERARDKEAHKRRLAALAQGAPALADALAAVAAEINAAATGSAPQGLHALLEAQAYRLAFWRVASDEINYRRFFDVNELAALRMEDEQVFEATHALVLELAASGAVDGLRVDHPDGLHDPAQYFERLQQGYARRRGTSLAPQADGRPARPLYVLAEKIAARHERMPENWAVHGTTGYRFAAIVNALFVDASADQRLERVWRGFTGEALGYEDLIHRAKHEIQRSSLASELTVLAAELLRIARGDLRTRDYTFNTLRRAIAEVAACMPVYRTYIAGPPSRQDRRYVQWAVAQAMRRSRAADTTVFGFLRQTLLWAALPGASDALRAAALRFAMKFQQFTAPLAAKGVEDTALYRFNRLVSLNEVGAEPQAFGMTVRAFHGANADRAARWPHTLLATSTHDNKRAEDVRQRINVISEMPAAWRLLLRRWARLNRGARRARTPSRNDEYLLYQTLLGTFPAAGLAGEALEAYRGRIERYMLKAAREAKRETSWANPDQNYEKGLADFVAQLLGRPNPFLEDLRESVAPIAWFGALNSLSMTLLKHTSPGVPDLYQGNELLDDSLVDPDNRRPVDFALRARLLEDVGSQPFGGEDWVRDGRAKLFVTARLLGARRDYPALLRDGAYAALESRGMRAANLVAYARREEGRTLVTIAGRLFATLLQQPGSLPVGAACWGDTAVAVDGIREGTRLRNLLTGETLAVRQNGVALAEAFATFPGAALLG